MLFFYPIQGLLRFFLGQFSRCCSFRRRIGAACGAVWPPGLHPTGLVWHVPVRCLGMPKAEMKAAFRLLPGFRWGSPGINSLFGSKAFWKFTLKIFFCLLSSRVSHWTSVWLHCREGCIVSFFYLSLLSKFKFYFWILSWFRSLFWSSYVAWQVLAGPSTSCPAPTLFLTPPVSAQRDFCFCLTIAVWSKESTKICGPMTWGTRLHKPPK